jgi:hypothetical protein
MKATQFLPELSTDLLARYKKAAYADARKADAEGDFERGNKRFKGINKATTKQFDNDKQVVAEVSKDTLDRYVTKAVDAHGHADFSARQSKDDPTKRSYHVDQKKTAEKRRQGISRALDRMSKTEGAPIVVAQAPIHIRNPKKDQPKQRYMGDIVPDTKPPSTEKRGVKGRPGQRPMPKQGVAEGWEEIAEWLAEEGKASRALCQGGKPDSQLGASQLASCKSQGLRARDGEKSHLIGKGGSKVRVTVGGKKIKGKKYGGPLPDYGTRKGQI